MSAAYEKPSGTTAEGSLRAQCILPSWMDPNARHEVCNDSSSAVAFARASTWLSYCVQNDSACSQPHKNFFPRRLINVNLGNEPCDPFLVEPTKSTTYACLSYCWGPDSNDVLRTTKDNIQAHYSGISIESMPQTIRDAVKVCRGLGISHLWVDSLCVMQGRRDEWLHDSSQMDLTYLNSYLTIAALEPASCKLGFLGHQLYSINAERPMTQHAVGGIRLLERRSSLNRRGWCLQEALLPNRRLCFNGREMSWECLCRKTCECGHHLWPNENEWSFWHEFDFGELGALLKRPRLASAYRPRASTDAYARSVLERKLMWLTGSGEWALYSSTMTRTRELWRHLVSIYSRRLLSHYTDKLAALSGLAKMTLNAIILESGCPDEYLAGLWSKEIYFELAWYVERAGERSSCPDDDDGIRPAYCAPSWSWAASDRSVKYDFSRPLWGLKYIPQAVDKCELVGATCIPELEGDSTGPVSYGQIELKGKLAAVELGMLETVEGSGELDRPAWDLRDIDFLRSESAEKGNILVRAQNLRPAWVIMDDPINPNVKLDDKRRICWLKGKCKAGCCLRDDEWQTEFYCFRLFSWWSLRGEKMGRETWFLLLERCRGDFYRRIGLGRQEVGRGTHLREHERVFGSVFEHAEEEIIRLI